MSENTPSAATAALNEYRMRQDVISVDDYTRWEMTFRDATITDPRDLRDVACFRIEHAFATLRTGANRRSVSNQLTQAQTVLADVGEMQDASYYVRSSANFLVGSVELARYTTKFDRPNKLGAMEMADRYGNVALSQLDALLDQETLEPHEHVYAQAAGVITIVNSLADTHENRFIARLIQPRYFEWLDAPQNGLHVDVWDEATQKNCVVRVGPHKMKYGVTLDLSGLNHPKFGVDGLALTRAYLESATRGAVEDKTRADFILRSALKVEEYLMMYFGPTSKRTLFPVADFKRAAQHPGTPQPRAKARFGGVRPPAKTAEPVVQQEVQEPDGLQLDKVNADNLLRWYESLRDVRLLTPEDARALHRTILQVQLGKTSHKRPLSAEDKTILAQLYMECGFAMRDDSVTARAHFMNANKLLHEAAPDLAKQGKTLRLMQLGILQDVEMPVYQAVSGIESVDPSDIKGAMLDSMNEVGFEAHYERNKVHALRLRRLIRPLLLSYALTHQGRLTLPALDRLRNVGNTAGPDLLTWSLRDGQVADQIPRGIRVTPYAKGNKLVEGVAFVTPKNLPDDRTARAQAAEIVKIYIDEDPDVINNDGRRVAKNMASLAKILGQAANRAKPLEA